jgi:hypothetical protein
LQSSLGSRLKEATEIRRRIVKILTDLDKSLNEGRHISSKLCILLTFDSCLDCQWNRANEKWEVGAISDSDEEITDRTAEGTSQTSELEELFLAIKAANSTLMKLSMLTRNSPARDDFLKAASRYNFDAGYDIGHAKENTDPQREAATSRWKRTAE